MSITDRYKAMFERLSMSGEGAFGAFLMLGDPDLETSARLLAAAALSTAWHSSLVMPHGFSKKRCLPAARIRGASSA